MVDQQEAEAIVMMKGKRTKRPRPVSSLTLAISEEESCPKGGENYSGESMERVGSTIDTTNDEDMAHCLILLAQGSKSNNSSEPLVYSKPNNNNNNNNKTNIGNSYECKTCNKSFPSFQALGGHRASHKKSKLGIGFEDYQTNKKSSIYSLVSDHNQAQNQLYDHQFNEDEIALSLHVASTTSNSSSNNNNNYKAKVHECSICGAEFSSGQALGGHMRRHRPIGGTTSINAIPSSSQVVHANKDIQEIKTHNFLSLDLNLPAPEDDHHQHQQQQDRDNSKFVFPLNGKTLVFSASSLVDCHY